MPAKKSAPSATAQSSAAARPHPTATNVSSTGRKPWVKKTPVDVVIEQLDKQEQRVSAMRDELAHEERELAKLQQARKVLEAQ